MTVGDGGADLARPQADLLAQFASARPRYELFTNSLGDLLKRLCASESLGVELSSRTKDLASLGVKLHKKPYVDFGEVPDLSGVRIIVQYREDVDKVCGLLAREFQVIEDEPHQFENPESFGYMSRHVVAELSSDRAGLQEWKEFGGMRCEVQVRTILQHAWASISHSLDYKLDSDPPPDVRRKLFQVAALIEIGDNLFQEFKTDLDVVREEYAESAQAGTWRDLPINSESLRSTQFEWLPLDLASQVKVRGLKVDVNQLQAPETQASQIRSTIVELSHLLDIESVGALADALAGDTLFEQMIDNLTEGGTFTVDYLVLLMLYMEALRQGLKIPFTVDQTWHSRSISKESHLYAVAKPSIEPIGSKSEAEGEQVDA